MNTPVSFELAKLLKKKEFDGNYFHYWNMVNHSGKWKIDTSIWEYTDDYIEAPTIGEVVMWLYEKHRIWIGVICDVGNDLLFTFKIYSIKIGEERCIVNGIMYESPIEAYEAGIEDVLINMI